MADSLCSWQKQEWKHDRSRSWEPPWHPVIYEAGGELRDECMFVWSSVCWWLCIKAQDEINTDLHDKWGNLLFVNNNVCVFRSQHPKVINQSEVLRKVSRLFKFWFLNLLFTTFSVGRFWGIKHKTWKRIMAFACQRLQVSIVEQF